mgnify:CR=1 FL=1
MFCYLASNSFCSFLSWCGNCVETSKLTVTSKGCKTKAQVYREKNADSGSKRFPINSSRVVKVIKNKHQSGTRPSRNNIRRVGAPCFHLPSSHKEWVSISQHQPEVVGASIVPHEVVHVVFRSCGQQNIHEFLTSESSTNWSRNSTKTKHTFHT